MKKSTLLFVLTLLSLKIFAQGTISGDLMMNLNFFQRDSSIRASDNPLYDNKLSGSEGWLDLRYTNKGFTVFFRADAFNNSNLYDPKQAMTNFGVGAWSVTKDWKDLSATVGYIYDQIGSGILFRAYEDRGLLIDNALVGIELKYKVNDQILLKGFSGQQKFLFSRYGPVIRGFNAEGDFNIGKAHILPGVGALNRTLDDDSYNAVFATVNGYPANARFEPLYNMYAFTAYNTLTVGNFSWYAEGAYKTHEAIVVPDYIKPDVDRPGNVEYTTFGYAQKGIAINLTGKRTEYFVMRTSPNEVLNNGLLNWQPIVARLRPQRLMSRYTPASQDISEAAGTADVLVSPTDRLNFTFTGTHINTLENEKLYREIYGEFNYQDKGTWVLQGGVQYLQYNLARYYTRAQSTVIIGPGVSPFSSRPILTAITPFAEATYRINTKKSVRLEVEYMNTQEDYGSWLYALLEYNVAPKWSVAVSDMYNIAPNKNPDNPNYNTVTNSVPAAQHYYNIYAAYTKGPHRFSLAYVKQVDGINCSGGVCRYEPAFSGVRGTITTSF